MSFTEVNAEAALERFLEYAAIAGPSGEEKDVADAIITALTQAGLSRFEIAFDGAESRCRIDGNCGNLIVTLPGKGHGERTLLSAHMDTVPICVGSQPEVQLDHVRSRSGTGLGADNRSGCAAILTAAVERLAIGDEKFPPAVLVFFVQEEIGLQGARHLDVAAVGPVNRAFNFDGGSVDKLTIGAVGGERISIRVKGIPAHAGVAPQQGASAIVMAARAIAELDARGWLGRVQHNGSVGSANIGVIHGGDATNVITPEVTLRAEARSHDPQLRRRIVHEIRESFERAAAGVAAEDGRTGSLDFESHVDYEAFRLTEQHPSLAAANDALRLLGRQPYTEVAGGGLDANWLFQHGIEAVTMGCGQRNIHTAEESLEIADYVDACRVATWLITDGAEGHG